MSPFITTRRLRLKTHCTAPLIQLPRLFTLLGRMDTWIILIADGWIFLVSYRVLLQTAFANFISDSAATVNFRNDTRAPLLLIAGGQDGVTPSSLIKANFDLYRESKAATDYKEFPNQTHFSLLRETKVADYVLGWALYRSNGSKLTAVLNQTDSWSVELST